MTDQKNPAAAVAPESFLGKFTVLFGAVRELWIVFALTILSNLATGKARFKPKPHSARASDSCNQVGG